MYNRRPRDLSLWEKIRLLHTVLWRQYKHRYFTIGAAICILLWLPLILFGYYVIAIVPAVISTIMAVMGLRLNVRRLKEKDRVEYESWRNKNTQEFNDSTKRPGLPPSATVTVRAPHFFEIGMQEKPKTKKRSDLETLLAERGCTYTLQAINAFGDLRLTVIHDRGGYLSAEMERGSSEEDVLVHALDLATRLQSNHPDEQPAVESRAPTTYFTCTASTSYFVDEDVQRGYNKDFS